MGQVSQLRQLHSGFMDVDGMLSMADLITLMVPLCSYIVAYHMLFQSFVTFTIGM